MKKMMFIFILFVLLSISKVNAACKLEDQVKINNAAGAVNASASRLEYNYDDHDDEYDEDMTVTSYTGVIYVYNLTRDIYFEISDDTTKEIYTYDDDVNGAVAVSTGSMAVVKNYNIAIYPTDKTCGTAPVRTIQVTLPRYNEYSTSSYCTDYPNYYYCQQFLNAGIIKYDDFMSGLNEYAKTHKKEEETRKEGILENTVMFIKKYWCFIVIIICIIIGITIFIKRYKDEKRKKEIV